MTIQIYQHHWFTVPENWCGSVAFALREEEVVEHMMAGGIQMVTQGPYGGWVVTESGKWWLL